MRCPYQLPITVVYYNLDNRLQNQQGKRTKTLDIQHPHDSVESDLIVNTPKCILVCSSPPFFAARNALSQVVNPFLNSRQFQASN